MTLEEIRASDKPTLTAADVGPVLGIRPERIRAQGRTHPERLGFPVCTAGRTARIPREGILAWLTGQGAARNDVT